MLRADGLALAALHAVRGLMTGQCVDGIVVIIRMPVVVDLLRVHRGEQFRDGDLLRAAVRAVAAAGALDEVLAAEDFLHLRDGSKLRFAQRLEVLHERDIVLHLLWRAHTGEHHQHAGESRGKADGIAGRAAAVQGIQNGARIVWQLDKVSTLDRLHDDDRLVELPADLIALAALDGGIVIVNIIELNLHDLDRGILCQDLLEQLGAAMKRNADVADLALFLQSKRRLISAAGLEMAIVLRALRMHKVEIKIIDPAVLELALEQRTDVRLGLEKVLRQLVRQDVAVAQITARQAGLSAFSLLPCR